MATKTTNHSGIITSAGTLFAANEARVSYKVTNLDTDVLFVKEGPGCSATDFDHILAAGTGADDGKGGTYETPAGQCYTGIITIAGVTPRCVGSEREEN